MSRIYKMRKKVISCLTLLILVLVSSVSVYADSELIDQDDIKSDNVTYKTIEASYGDLIVDESAGGTDYYPIKKPVIYDGSDAVFVQLLVERNGYVEAGDPILEISVAVDDVAIEETKLKLQRENESYAAGVQTRQNRINEMNKSLQEAEGTEYQKISLKIQQAQVSLQQYTFQETKTIQDLQEQLDELQADGSVQYIYAPISGSISDMLYFTEGMEIASGTTICTITDETVRIVKCSDTAFAYGREATINSGTSTNKKISHGTVVASSAILPGATSDFCLIEVTDGEIAEEMASGYMRGFSGSVTHLTVSVNTTELKNILVVPNSARTLEGGSVYVTVLGDDGAARKRLVQSVLTSKDGVWVLNGLEIGEKLVVQ